MERNFSQRVRNVLGYSREEAARLQTPYIGPEHLLLGILRDGSGKAVEALQYLGIKSDQLKHSVEEKLRMSHDISTIDNHHDIVINKSTDKVLKTSLLEARLLKSEVTDAEHLLLAILRDSTTLATQTLNAFDVTYQNVSDYVRKRSSYKPFEEDTHVSPSMGPEFAVEDDDEIENGGPFSKK